MKPQSSLSSDGDQGLSLPSRKRVKVNGRDEEEAEATAAQVGTLNEYCGYTPEEGQHKIEEYELSYLREHQAEFFNSIVKPRKPIKITGGLIDGIEPEKFTSKNIVDYLNYDGTLKVERKHESGYGLGYKRVQMKLSKLLAKFRSGEFDYYLTTQYEDEDEDESERDSEDDEDDDEEDNVGEDDDDKEEEEEEEEAVEQIEELDSNEESDAAEAEIAFRQQQQSKDIQESKAKVTQGENKGYVSSEHSFQNVRGADTSDYSDTDSIDFNNLRDDYVDSDDVSGLEVDEEDDYESRLKELLQPPLTNVIVGNKKFPLIPDILTFLIPQQINLWIGANNLEKTAKNLPKVEMSKPDFGLGRYVPRNGVSSGLHHDHSDNLYILFQGYKRFTLIAPSDAPFLNTVGEICKIYKTGIIDYNAPNWTHVRDDGKMLEDEKSPPASPPPSKPANFQSTPPSFSQIPPVFLHLDEIEDLTERERLTKIVNERYPDFLKLKKLEVWLSPGQMLYLPAGWFHEVTSYGFDPRKADVGVEKNPDTLFSNPRTVTEEDTVHIALNYWFAPPNGETIGKPYVDSYWKDSFTDLVEYIEEKVR